MAHSILIWIATGLIIGLLAARILPRHEPGRRFVTILFALAGAVVGGAVDLELSRLRDGPDSGWIAAGLGAVVLLAVYRLFMRGREDS